MSLTRSWPRQDTAVARPNEGETPGSKIVPVKLTTEETLETQPDRGPVACREMSIVKSDP